MREFLISRLFIFVVDCLSMIIIIATFNLIDWHINDIFFSPAHVDDPADE